MLFVNDSKATNADAAGKALASFDDIYWIVGGQAKDGGLDGLEPFYPKIARAYLIGEAAEAFAAPARRRGRSCGVRHARARRGGGRRRRRAGRKAAEPVVLLSPACASYDQFANFAKRGDAFRDIVMGLDGATRVSQQGRAA